MIKINKLGLRNLDNKHLKKAGGHIGRNVVKITIKMKTIVRKPLMIKNQQLFDFCTRRFSNFIFYGSDVIFFINVDMLPFYSYKQTCRNFISDYRDVAILCGCRDVAIFVGSSEESQFHFCLQRQIFFFKS